MVLDHQQPLMFPMLFSSIFMFFQNRSPGAFLEGPRAELKKKKNPLGHLFAQAVEQKEVPQMTRAVLLATLFFTKPY